MLMLYRVVLIGILVVIAACQKKEQFDGVKIIGHAGAGLSNSTSPYHDNTKEAVEYAIALDGIDGVEIDIQCSASETIWLFHDEQLDDETTGNGCMNSLSDLDLSTIHYTGFGQESLIRLSDLQFPFSKKELFLDVRSSNFCTQESIDQQQMIQAIEQALPSNDDIVVKVITNRADWVHAFYLKGWMVYLNLAQTADYLNTAVINETVGLCIRNAEISHDEVKSVQEIGKEVIIFEVRSPKGIRKAFKKYPNYLMTDNLKATLIEKYP